MSLYGPGGTINPVAVALVVVAASVSLAVTFKNTWSVGEPVPGLDESDASYRGRAGAECANGNTEACVGRLAYGLKNNNSNQPPPPEPQPWLTLPFWHPGTYFTNAKY